MSPRAAALLEVFGFEDVWDYAAGKMDWISRGLPIEGAEAGRMTAGILVTDAALLDIGMTPNDAVKMIDQHEGNAGVVVKGGGTVLGLLLREAADKADGDTVESVMEFGPKTYRANQDPAEALDYMEEHDLQHVVIADPEGKLIGMIYRDVVEREVRGES